MTFFVKTQKGSDFIIMEKNVLLILNPKSGDGEAKRWVFDMEEAFLSLFDYVTVYFSKYPGDITRVVREKAGNFDAVICVGGDGTLSETVNGIHQSGSDPMLGYIPTGTVNDFATSHGIPKGIKGAIETIVSGTPAAYDLGLLGDACFSYVAAFGAFTDVAYLTPQLSKAAFGKSAYFAEGMKRILSLTPICASVQTARETVEGSFLFGMVSNSKTVGGFRFFENNTEDDLRDGMLELLLIRYPRTPAAFQDAIFGLLNPKIQNDAVIRMRASEFFFSFPDGKTPWTMDGEFGGDHERITVRCLEKRIRVIESTAKTSNMFFGKEWS